VLIDFENVQPQNLGALSGRTVRIKVFLGSNQAKIPVAIAQAMQTFGPDAEYIQIEGSGSNALDFHIAYYIGRLVAEYPGASFHIVSRDTGFDPLIRHLKAKGISCHRTKALSEIAPVKIANPARTVRRSTQSLTTSENGRQQDRERSRPFGVPSRHSSWISSLTRNSTP